MIYPGQDTREYFAGLTMQVLYKHWIDEGWDLAEHPEIWETIAIESFLMADAMMEAGGHR